MEGTSADSPPWSQVRLDVGAFDVQVNQTLSAVSSPPAFPPQRQRLTSTTPSAGLSATPRGRVAQTRQLLSSPPHDLEVKEDQAATVLCPLRVPQWKLQYTLSRRRADARPSPTERRHGSLLQIPTPIRQKLSPLRCESRRSDELIHGHQHRGDGEARGNCSAYNWGVQLVAIPSDHPRVLSALSTFPAVPKGDLLVPITTIYPATPSLCR